MAHPARANQHDYEGVRPPANVVPVGSLVLDVSGRLMEMNPAAPHLFTETIEWRPNLNERD